MIDSERGGWRVSGWICADRNSCRCEARVRLQLTLVEAGCDLTRVIYRVVPAEGWSWRWCRDWALPTCLERSSFANFRKSSSAMVCGIT